MGGGGARRGIGGRGHRPCSDTYSGFSEQGGGGGWIRVRRERKVRWCWREGVVHHAQGGGEMEVRGGGVEGGGGGRGHA